MREKLPNLPIIYASPWKKNRKTRILVTYQNQFYPFIDYFQLIVKMQISVM